MPIYNTLVPVVACIEETDEKAAIARLTDAVTSAGFDAYEEGQNAFESEEGTEVTELPESTPAAPCPRVHISSPGENPYW